MIVFAAATGLRPGECLALERRDVDREARVVYVRRAFTNGRLKHTKTESSVRAVPLQAIALAALEELPRDSQSRLFFPSPRSGYLDLRNFRNRHWKPAQLETGIEPLRRIYDLRHTFATFALRAGISTFELSRYMGHEPADGRPPLRPSRPRRARARDPASGQLHRRRRPPRGRSVDAAEPGRGWARTRKLHKSRRKARSPESDSNRRPLPYHGGRGIAAVSGRSCIWLQMGGFVVIGRTRICGCCRVLCCPGVAHPSWPPRYEAPTVRARARASRVARCRIALRRTSRVVHSPEARSVSQPPERARPEAGAEMRCRACGTTVRGGSPPSSR